MIFLLFPLLFLQTLMAAPRSYSDVVEEVKRLMPLPASPVVVELGTTFSSRNFREASGLSHNKYYYADPGTPPGASVGTVVAHQAKLAALRADRGSTVVTNLETIPETTVDLFVSLYGFTDLTAARQIHYLDRMISKAKNGYIVIDNIYGMESRDNSLTFYEICRALGERNISVVFVPIEVRNGIVDILLYWKALEP